MKRTVLKTNKGFTLLEALVAISILMVAVVAPITIAQKGLSSAVYTKNQMIASYLAQDALEYIKNKRDENIKKFKLNNAIGWLDGFADCLNSNRCRIDTKVSNGDGLIESASTGSNILKKDTDGFYGFDGTPTNFSRIIKIDQTSAEDLANKEARVTATVTWDDNKVEIVTWLYNY